MRKTGSVAIAIRVAGRLSRRRFRDADHMRRCAAAGVNAVG
jgi:hypothetical protein